MWKKIIPSLVLVMIVLKISFSFAGPTEKKLHVYTGADTGLKDQNNLLLSGNGADCNPFVKGCLVQLIRTVDNNVNPPSPNGLTTGDDVIYSTHRIGDGFTAPSLCGVITGAFDIILDEPNFPTGKIYVRVFNKPYVSEATYYGDSSVVSASSLFTVGLDIYFKVTNYGLTKTDKAFSPSSFYAPVVVAGGPYIINEGDSLQLDASATADQDDSMLNLTFEWDLDCDGMYDDAVGVNPLMPSSLFVDDQIRTISLKVTDPQNHVSYGTAQVTVNNAVPVVSGSFSDLIINEGDAVDILASYTDPGFADTHSIDINWGDGSVANNIPLINGSISFSHQFSDFGAYSVSFTVKDKDGGSDSKSFSIQVNRVDIGLNIIVDDGKKPVLSWNAVDSKEYEVWFTDSSFEKFGTADMVWNIAGIVGTGSFTDMGDNDGYDNIPNNADDRVNPKNVAVRYYRIVLRGSVEAGSPWASSNIAFFRNIHLYKGRNFVGKTKGVTLNDVLDMRFLSGNKLQSLSVVVDYWKGFVGCSSYLYDDKVHDKEWLSLLGGVSCGLDLISDGTGILVTLPVGSGDILMPLCGIVKMDDSISVPIKKNGSTVLSLPYEGELSLDNSGLLESGFYGNTVASKSDKVYFYNPSTQQYDQAVYYYKPIDGSAGMWKYLDGSICSRKIKAGEGFMVKTTNTTTLSNWVINRPYPKTSSDMGL